MPSGPSHLSYPHFLYEWPSSPTFSVIANDECPLTCVSQSETTSRRRLLWTIRGVHKIPPVSPPTRTEPHFMGITSGWAVIVCHEHEKLARADRA